MIDLNISSIEGLSRNTLGSQGCKPLSHSLSLNQYLLVLNLSGNFIGDHGVSYICQGLKKGPNKTLI